MKSMNVAVVGAGYLGTIHARIYSELENANLVGIVDIDTKKGKEVADRYNTQYYDKIDDIIDKVEAVSIAVPTSYHLEASLPFIKKKKALLIEKPIAHNIEAAKAIIKEAEINDSLVQIGHLERFNPVVTFIKSKIDNPYFIEFLRIGPYVPRCKDVDVVRDLMIHDLDLINYLINKDILSIDAIGMPVLSETTDIANARVIFSYGCRANLITSRISTKKERRIRLFQKDGYYSLDLIGQTGNFTYRTKEEGNYIIKQKDLEISKDEPLKLELQSFLDCTAENKKPVITAQDGLKALELSQRINDSLFMPDL